MVDAEVLLVSGHSGTCPGQGTALTKRDFSRFLSPYDDSRSGYRWSALRSPLEPFLFALSPVNSGTALPHLRRKRFPLQRSFPPFMVELFAVRLASTVVETRAHRRKGLLAVRDVFAPKLPTRPTLSEPFQVLAPSTGFAPSSWHSARTCFHATGLISFAFAAKTTRCVPVAHLLRTPWDRGHGLLLQSEGLLGAASLALQGQALGRTTHVVPSAKQQRASRMVSPRP